MITAPSIVIPLMMISIGCLCCFYGKTLFKVLMVLIGFFLGLYCAIVYAGNLVKDQNILIIIAIAVGILLGLLILSFYYAGIFIAGCVATLFLLDSYGLRWNVAELSLFLKLIIALAGGIFTLIFQKFMIIVATSVIGSYSIVYGVTYLFHSLKYGSFSTFKQYQNFLKTTSSEMYYLILFAVAIIAVLGIVLQMKLIPQKKE